LFPIDVVYLRLGGEVLHLMENVSPFRVTPLRPSAHSVLELPVRTIYESQTRVGDQVVICSAESLEGASSTKDWLNQVAEKQLEEGVEEPAAAMRWPIQRPEGS
jgi:hypothetical protein